MAEQLVLRRETGAEPLTLLGSSVPLRKPDGQIDGAIFVFQDISTLKQAEKRRTSLLAAMTHDVKNPLATIKLLSAIAERRATRSGVDVERVVKDSQDVQVMASRAAAMLDNMMQIARQEMGLPMRLVKGPCDLVMVAKRILKEHQATTEIHQLRMTVPQEPLVGMWDETGLASVLDNLLSNAVKYSPAGGDIDVLVSHSGNWVTLSVHDTGRGIREEELSHIFEPFYRAQGETSISGTGVGLAIAKDIVEAHGGTITVESAVGEGTTFTVRLPLNDRRPGEGG